MFYYSVFFMVKILLCMTDWVITGGETGPTFVLISLCLVTVAVAGSGWHSDPWLGNGEEHLPGNGYWF